MDASLPVQNESPGAPQLRFDIFTLFPAMFAGPFDESIVGRARARGMVDVALHDIRSWATDRHRTIDDAPYGGGAGMVMKAPPIVQAVEQTLTSTRFDAGTRIIILSAAGRLFDQRLAIEFAQSTRIAMICGHYEGIDERVSSILAAEEISVGDFVLTGGELAAMAIVDAVSRLVPGVISGESIVEESHGLSLVEYPHFTRPIEFRGHRVPDILVSGHHADVAKWRRQQALLRTARRRPDLLAYASLSEAERGWLSLQTIDQGESDN